ncbi:hypothetical protein RhiirA1_471524 [Rhizophagus irregularis]|uniref:Uncharacterized protein n=3 Tax=Rhizophagus irregularis TaxID=588596 RepID=A0A2I1F914_9GLOM|nr:hypothetical protein GLOIN_2v1787448 [Rhizophagus irregularis DAOM 181602=DAOM 197198]PKC58075.1 hypothetical protein RhiirA1_471524 [Rhizophagus irregularis]PKY30869.1 hypothetical protein RhiirB3_448169 [Rhizophagus irregularis]POG60767.1 hypothetical protein GLOIN_2v1787448 [Rhizophagus irregularis DAOM 181602=DAOM 197198]|eukprot:XP_025167633.1 hypothetical protein GLOIN_2v1787448 [Rhizophagus irregularis DAOM 181602=DAOM 197198]
MFKIFLYDMQNKFDEKQQTNEEDYFDINNPNIIKHKGHPSKKLQSDVEQSFFKGKYALINSIKIDENVKSSKGRCWSLKALKYGYKREEFTTILAVVNIKN